MARSLVIVESPGKVKTINKYLGKNYTVRASYGHVMDLPKKNIGILLPGEQNGKPKKKKRKTKAKAGAPEKKVPKPVVVTAENIFEPTYEVIPGKIKVITDLQKAARGVEAIYLAGDPDREGEAICAHLAEILGRPKKYAEMIAKAQEEIIEFPGIRPDAVLVTPVRRVHLRIRIRLIQIFRTARQPQAQNQRHHQRRHHS